jgi:hypothetical protein
MKSVTPLKRKRRPKKKAIEPILLPKRKVISLQNVQADCKVCNLPKRVGKLISGIGFLCEPCYEISKEFTESLTS